MVGYRKKVVRTNLQNSFPEYAEEKRLLIERQFYGHFCDLIVESIKAFTISREELEKRFVHRNPELFPPKPWFVSHETTGLNFGTFNSCESRTYKAAC
jgi:lauroyl/myristoyl acyltransferase